MPSKDKSCVATHVKYKSGPEIHIRLTYPMLMPSKPVGPPIPTAARNTRESEHHLNCEDMGPCRKFVATPPAATENSR
eukprot:11187708-Lingulodinium_polyedra.AAC.1